MVEEDTDEDEIMTCRANTLCSHTVSAESTPIPIRAHMEYTTQPWYPNGAHAISDGGADACILGHYAKVLTYTGRHANLVGYDPACTQQDKVPIVTALIKVVTDTTAKTPVLLKVHEAPY